MRKNTPKNDDKMVSDSQGKSLPETVQSGDIAPAVKDLPPANPLGEPVEPVENYPNTSEAGKAAAALGVKTEEDDLSHPFGETVVEHPLSPTDANPNPHGQRSQLEITNTVVDKDTKVSHRVAAEEGDIEVEGLSDAPVHLGDGRTLAKGESTKVSKDLLKDENLKGKIKRV